ncbi:MAG: hypothetical protein R2762_25080 [Bryobacteraceae bacterium]
MITVDTRQPQAEALAIRDRWFLAVGTSGEMRGLARKGTVVDAKGATIVLVSLIRTTMPGAMTLLYQVLVGTGSRWSS